MEYITRQCQGDFCLLDQRDGDLWMDFRHRYVACSTGLSISMSA